MARFLLFSEASLGNREVGVGWVANRERGLWDHRVEVAGWVAHSTVVAAILETNRIKLSK